MTNPRPRDESFAAPRPSTRRAALGLRTSAAATAAVSDHPTAGCEILLASRPAMGSRFEVRLPAGAPGAADLATRALDEVDALEEQLTIYRDDSEIARINATAHLGPVVVESNLFDLLATAVRLSSETAGAYDVVSGALSEAWGFTRGPRRVPSVESKADAMARTGSHHLRLDPAAKTIAFDRPGIAINLGSIGKGYAIDRAAAVVRKHWFPISAIVHGGRSSLYALGSPPDDFGGRWVVALNNPLDPAHPAGLIRLRDRGMGTSGAAFQQFEENGRRYGHLIDPRTGEPPEFGPLSVTVLAPTAAEADALSTALYLLGRDAAADLVARRPEIGVIILTEGRSPDRPVVNCWGLSSGDFEPARASASSPSNAL